MSSLIAVVDDDGTLRSIIKGILSARGYQVVEADSATACINLCSTIRPDLVLLDAMMPEIDGFECCSQLRSSFSKDELPIVMVTGLEDASVSSKAIDAGANQYVAKPIQWPQLFAAIEEVLAA